MRYQISFYAIGDAFETVLSTLTIKEADIIEEEKPEEKPIENLK